MRARVDGEAVDIAEFLQRTDRLARYEQHTIQVVVDRLVNRAGLERRLTDSLETALKLAEGVAEIELVPREGDLRPDGSLAETEILTFSQHLVCPDVRHELRRARTAELLVQLPVRRLRAVRRPRHHVRGRPRARHPEHRPVGERGRDRPVEHVADAVLHPHARSGGRGLRHRSRLAVGEAHEEAAGHPAVRREGQRAGQVQEPVRPDPPVQLRLRGHHPVPPAPPRRRRVGVEPRAGRELHARGAVPALRRRPPAAGDARRDDQRQAHRRGLRDADRRVVVVPRRAGALRAGQDDRRAGDEGDQRPARLPARRRPRLPLAGPFGGHARRRRGTADPAGLADRVRPRGHAVRARRAVDRPPPAGQPAPDRHDAAPARPRQHGHRRRARRGDDQGGRLDRRHRSGCRRARRRGRLLRPGEGAHEDEGVDHGPVPVREEEDPGPEAPTPTGRGVADDPRCPGAQPAEHRREHPARVLRLGHRCVRFRQVVARARHPAAVADAEDLQVEGRARQAQDDRRASACSTR